MAQSKKMEVVTNEQKEKLNQIKHTLCIAIKNIERKQFISSKNMAFMMGTTASRLSEVQRLQYDKLTLNQLFHYLIRLDPDFEVQILYRYYSSAELPIWNSKTEEGFFEN